MRRLPPRRAHLEVTEAGSDRASGAPVPGCGDYASIPMALARRSAAAAASDQPSDVHGLTLFHGKPSLRSSWPETPIRSTWFTLSLMRSGCGCLSRLGCSAYTSCPVRSPACWLQRSRGDRFLIAARATSTTRPARRNSARVLLGRRRPSSPTCARRERRWRWPLDSHSGERDHGVRGRRSSAS